ncbi:hypothetical protein SBI_07025 [Streptomyces bingchenggensis BCW-1]|uniref:DUF397 domain-containing protein n=1 Tax=Streptomyces bingchenggensis (strain BCW-1) TaxID=749414 RepID=D7C3C0_STRBB|nr:MULTISPECIES: DUF397 domain-containing protein [Streptomyces]ADI10145.1 hypothetical protein SBI_07025 [Streptomyces bingchenggensis BCW-1]
MHEIDLAGAKWRKSSYSSGNGQCVEAAFLPTMVATRDSKDPQGPALVFSADGWASFVTALASGGLLTA